MSFGEIFGSIYPVFLSRVLVDQYGFVGAKLFIYLVLGIFIFRKKLFDAR